MKRETIKTIYEIIILLGIIFLFLITNLAKDVGISKPCCRKAVKHLSREKVIKVIEYPNLKAVTLR